MEEKALAKWTSEQVAVIKNTVARGASDAELALFAQVCARTGLDPFARQIHLIKRRVQEGDEWKTVMTPQTGIDGYRVIAERSGKYGGQDAPIFEERDGKLFSATVAVHRKDFPRPIVATAFYDEYVQIKRDGTPNTMWAKMPRSQLAKCAEALALRKAFPQDLSGVYTHDEMAQADNPIITVETVSIPPQSKPKQLAEPEAEGNIQFDPEGKPLIEPGVASANSAQLAQLGSETPIPAQTPPPAPQDAPEAPPQPFPWPPEPTPDAGAAAPKPVKKYTMRLAANLTREYAQQQLAQLEEVAGERGISPEVYQAIRDGLTEGTVTAKRLRDAIAEAQRWEPAQPAQADIPLPEEEGR